MRTALAPIELLHALQAIEARHGRHALGSRMRRARSTSTCFVLGSCTIDTPELALPHPRLHERAFVLVPLAEIAPGLDIPGRGRVEALLARVASQSIAKLNR